MSTRETQLAKSREEWERKREKNRRDRKPTETAAAKDAKQEMGIKESQPAAPAESE